MTNRVPRPGTVTGAFVLTAGLLVCSTAALAAQHRNPAVIDSLLHVQSVEPRSGPPGTTVRIFTENLPLQARVHVGLGARHVGWEALAEARQNAMGAVRASIEVPDYWSWDRPLVFIVFNGIFSPIAISDPFHVTNAQGQIQRAGTITDEGVECVAMRDQDDYLYTLSGSHPDLEAGDEVVVVGYFREMSMCQQGNALEVVSVKRVNSH